MSRRIGIFGGSFNPIHIGHLVIAEAAWQEFSLDKVIFVPTGDTPNKDMHHISKYMRYEMVAKAIEGNSRFAISSIERDRTGPSYTVDTIHMFREQFGKEDQLYFICGTDSIADLPNWKYNVELLKCCEFISASRPGNEEEIIRSVSYFGDLGKEKIHFLRSPELNISSTILRKLIAKNKSVKYLVPDAVIQFIHENDLYKDTL
jgi:nicotinate-nucleotide adenylyltransferase